MTTNITKANVSEYVVTGEFDIPFSVKSDIDSEESKSGTLRFRMDCVPLGDIIASSLKDKRINWQATARKKFESISGSIIVVDYKGGRQPVDPKQSTKAFLASMTTEARLKWLKEQGLV
jgi:hypothetical protein